MCVCIRVLDVLCDNEFPFLFVSPTYATFAVQIRSDKCRSDKSPANIIGHYPLIGPVNAVGHVPRQTLEFEFDYCKMPFVLKLAFTFVSFAILRFI